MDVSFDKSEYITDKFVHTSMDLDIRFASAESKQFDYIFADSTGRHRIIGFEYADSKIAAEKLMYFTFNQISSKYKLPWFGIVKSKYAEFYSNDDLTGSFFKHGIIITHW